VTRPRTARTAHAYLDTSLGQVHVEEAGIPGSPLVVLLAQWPFPTAVYRQLLQVLGDRCHAVAVDLPGFGWSPAPPRALDVAENAQVVLDVISALGARQAVLFGRAASSVIVTAAAAADPAAVSALFLHGPFAHSEEERAVKHRLAWSAPELAADGEHLIVCWQRVRDRYPALSLELTNTCALAHATAASVQSEAYRSVWSVDNRSLLADLRQPVHVLVGRDEVLGRLVDRYPSNVELVGGTPRDGATDFVAIDEPEELAGLILDLVAQSA
jgi:pimeloyl-ACP methyl ester carboxylesterase